MLKSESVKMFMMLLGEVYLQKYLREKFQLNDISHIPENYHL